MSEHETKDFNQPDGNPEHVKRNSQRPVYIPGEEKFREKLLIYIHRQVKKRKEPDAGEMRSFFRYLGLESDNLRGMLENPAPFEPLSGQDYTWGNIYGKNAVLNIFQYMKEKSDMIRSGLNEKKEEILDQIRQCLMRGFQERGDALFAALMLDRSNDTGLSAQVRREKARDYQYLIEMNRCTYEEIRIEDMNAAKEKAGIFGHREECIDDIFSSVDHFLQQRYEIYRYMEIESIYEEILSFLEPYECNFPEGEISERISRVFDEMKITERFGEIYLQTFDLSQFTEQISYSSFLEMMRNTCPDDDDGEKKEGNLTGI